MDKRVLITGARGALASALSLRLAETGYSLILHCSKSQKQVEELARSCLEEGSPSVEIFKADFSTEEGVIDLAEKVARGGSLFALINNVGPTFLAPLLKTPLESWYSLFQTNLHAPFILIQKLLPLLTASKGRVINLGLAGLNRGKLFSCSTAYGLAKGALFNLTAAFAKEVAPDVTVNMVSPGYLPGSEALPELNRLPMGRTARLEEVVKVLLFLLEEDSSYITGQNIEVAGAVGL